MKKHAMLLSAVAMLSTGVTGFCAEEIGTSEQGIVLAKPPPTPACKRGFVWREAVPGDRVCVKADARDQAARDNRMRQQR